MCPKEQDNRTDQASHRTEPVTKGGPITRQDIQAVLSDPGYSAPERKGRLKELLTALTDGDGPADRELSSEIKAILAEQVPGKSIAENDL